MPRALRIRPALKISCSTNVVVNVMVHGPGRPEIKTPLPTDCAQAFLCSTNTFSR